MSLFGTHLVSVQYEQFASLSQSTQHPRNNHSNEIHTEDWSSEKQWQPEIHTYSSALSITGKQEGQASETSV